MIWNELGIGGGTALIVLCALYFVVKWAVRGAIVEAHAQIAGKKQSGPRALWYFIVSEDAPSE